MAVVGLGCVVPDAPSPDAFWSNALCGHTALRPLDGWRWEADRYYHPDRSVPDRTHCRVGAPVRGHAFEWRKYRISPASARAMNPMQLYLLDAGSQALASVRQLPRERTGIFVGASGLGWKPDAGLSIRLADLLDAVRGSDAFAALSPGEREAVLDETRRALTERLEPVSEDHAVNPGASIAAGRIAMQFDLHGLHYGVDAGGASSLAALEMGVRSLRDGTVDLALIGGASELLTPLQLVAHAKLGVLARETLLPFDPDAEGTLLGEGAVFFALKRLDEAIGAGERIHAVVRGVAGATGAEAGPGGMPGPEAQRLAMARAYDDAGVPADSVGFVECHAAGIPAGDAAELRALAEFFRGRPRASVALGSSKALVGDLGAAGGAVGLLRAVLALHHGELPPQVGPRRVHPLLADGETPLFVPRERRAVEAVPGADRARAGVNALGLGGASYHAVVEAHVPGPAPRARRRGTAPERVAVVGLGAVLPGAHEAAAFWRSLIEGRDATREMPRGRWEMDRYFDPDPRRNEKTYARLGAYLDQVPSPEERWSIPAAALPSLDPEQLLVLRAAEEALADAGLDRDARHRSRTAVILGVIPVPGKRYLADARVSFREFEVELERSLARGGIQGARALALLAEAERRYKAALPPITEHTLPGFLGSVIAARVARLFGMGGPHFVVDSACSSTLAALHAAVQGLRERAFDVAVCGGVWADTQPEFLIGMSRFYGVSASGITPFDARASGFLMGEGTGILVLQRLSDAEREGRHVHALIRSVAGSSDGRGRSIFAPSPEGEADAMCRAIAEAKIAPTDLDYIECHGTGTPVGDVAEIDACTRAYGTNRPRPLLVGSVKSNLGHLMSASGAPALVKTVLAVRDGVIPPSLKCDQPNPKIDFSAGPVKVVTEATPWPPTEGRPRMAGVNAFGLGGTNFHAIVEQYLPAATEAATGRRAPATAPAPRILPIAAAGGDDLAECARRLRALARQASGWGPARRMEALGRSQEEAAASAGWRIAVVAVEPDLLARRAAMLERELERGGDLAYLRQQGVFAARPGRALRAAALFPGQGPQYPNMGREALAAFPELGETLDAVDRTYERLCGRPLRPSFFTDEPASHSQKDEDAHCAVFAVNVALFRLLQRYGLRVDAVMGQSAGEISALVAAGVLALEEGLQAVRERTLAVLALDSSDPGRMVSLGCGVERTHALLADLPGYAVVAADNGPSACIVSAAGAAARALVERAGAKGIRAEVLPVSHAYHSRMIEGARPRYRAALERLSFRRPQIEVVSTITGASIRDLPAERFPDHLSSQFVEPVRLRQAVETLYASETRLFLECGPKWPLSTFVGEILSPRPHVAQASLHPKVGEVEQLHRALACFLVHGIGEVHPMRFVRKSSTPPLQPAVESPPPRAPAPASTLEGDLVALLTGVRDLIDGFLRTARAPAHREQPPEAPAVAAGAPAAPAPPAREVPVSNGPAPGSRPASAPGGAAAFREDVRRLLVEQFARRTGYPEDMLELDLDLEADLGIDTVKQVAVLSAVREQLGLPRDPAFRLRDFNTLGKIIEYLARRRDAGASPPTAIECAGEAPAPAATAVSGDGQAAGRAGGPLGAGQPAGGGAAPAGPEARGPAAIAAPTSAAVARAHRMLLDELVKRTGYPEDMLELDLDLEAELGIDTVKQVAALAAVRDAMGLPPDPSFRLREANTLRKVLDHFARRLEKQGGREEPAPPPPAAPVRAGPPRERSDAPPPADGRAATPAPAARFVRPPAPPPPAMGQELLASMIATARDQLGSGVGEMAELTVAPSQSASANGEILTEVTPGGQGRIRVTASDREARLEALFGAGPAGPPAEAPPEMLATASIGDAPENGDRIRQILRDHGGEPIEWVRSRGAGVVVGGARLDAAQDAPALVASLLRCATRIASYGWYELTGSPHRLAAIDRVRLGALPPAGARLLIHARVGPSRGGRWRADVTVLEAGGRVAAELAGACGLPMAELPGAVGSEGPRDAAAAWQALSREMSEPPPRHSAADP